jgi:uncharacterized protein YkwD
LLSSLAEAAGPSRYNEPAQPTVRSPLVDKIVALVAKLARDERRTEPRPDARLDAAAADIARLMPENAAPSNELVEGALWLHGIVEPPPHLLVAAMDPRSKGDELLRQLAADLPSVLAQGRYSRLGVALVPAGSDVRVLVALQESYLQLDPMPRALPDGGPMPLRGQLGPAFERPEALVTAPDGSVTRMALNGDAHRFNGAFHCGPRKGRYQIEVVGEDRFGATVLANFPVWCGVVAPATVEASAPAASDAREEPFASAAQAEQAVWKLLNADRAHAGLPSLEWDARLADVARAHSADMQAHNFFGHVSPSTGTAADRVKHAKIDALVIMENVARAATAGEAERGLMNSPGHRANILNHEATRVGVGIVVASDAGGQRELLVTQLFMKPPEAFSTRTIDDLRRGVADWRKAHRLQALELDANLDHLAHEAVNAIVQRGESAEAAGRRIDAGLDRDRWLQVRSAVAMVVSVGQIIDELKNPLGDGSATHYGLAVMPGRRPDGGSGLFVVLVLGSRR